MASSAGTIDKLEIKREISATGFITTLWNANGGVYIDPATDPAEVSVNIIVSLSKFDEINFLYNAPGISPSNGRVGKGTNMTIYRFA